MPVLVSCVDGVKMEPFYQDMATKIYNGDALAVLKTLPDESVQMCMCSPPYWGLRNYAGGEDIIWGGDENCQHIWIEETQGLQHENRNNLRGTQESARGQTPVAFIQKYDRPPSGTCVLCGAWRGQLGLEPTPSLYVEHLMMIFREVKRVLRKDGSFYLNIGDTYSSHTSKRSGQFGKDIKEGFDDIFTQSRPPASLYGLQEKCMTCIPERVMFAMLDAGFVLRNKIIWHKPNSMPSSVKDRFTTTWEYLYFFTKARKYYFDLDAIRIPHKTLSLERYQRGVNLDRPAIGKSAEVGPMQQYKRAPQWFQDQFPPDQDYKGKFDDIFGHGPNPQSFNLRVRDVKRGKGGATAQGGELKASEKEIAEYEYPEKMQRHHGSGPQYKLSGLGRGLTKHDTAVNRTGNVSYTDPLHTRDYSPKGKNPGDVIEGYDSKYLESDYGQPLQGFQRDQTIEKARAQSRKDAEELYPSDPKKQQEYINFIHDHQSHPKGKNPGDYWEITTQPSSICVCPKCETIFPRYTKVCPTCGIEGVVGHFAPYPVALCETPIKASTRMGDVVLDPLAGGGNTGVAAKKLGRKCILIDCVKEYCIMAQYKLSKIEYQPELEISC